MYRVGNYAQPFRAIGQALEVLQIEAFDIESDGDAYLVRGSAAAPPDAESVGESAVQHIWGLIPGRAARSSKVGTAAVSPAQIELRYTPEDLDRLESEGQARRRHTHEMPDTSSVSQVLRALGDYLNYKRARWLKIMRKEQVIVIEYETPAGQKIEEILSGSDLYDFWVRMYMKRSGRGNA